MIMPDRVATNIEDGYLSDEFEQHVDTQPPIRDGDFSEYMWMENEEQFDAQEIRKLEEEELVVHCLEDMLDEEGAAESGQNNASGNKVDAVAKTHRPPTTQTRITSGGANAYLQSYASGRRSGGPVNRRTELNISTPRSITNQLNSITIAGVKDVKLNPDAQEFVPFDRARPSDEEDAPPA